MQKFVSLLLYRGARPTLRDNTGRTALHHAADRNFLDVCQRLLEHGALPHARDHLNQMPYTIALKHHNDALASLMLAFMPNQM